MIQRNLIALFVLQACVFAPETLAQQEDRDLPTAEPNGQQQLDASWTPDDILFDSIPFSVEPEEERDLLGGTN